MLQATCAGVVESHRNCVKIVSLGLHIGLVEVWDAHLARPHNSYTWAARLREFRGKQWLIEKRAQSAPSVASRESPAFVRAGRTGT